MFFKVALLLLGFFVTVNNTALVGGPIDADINDSEVQNALQFAVAQHNMKSNDMFVSSVSKVISVKKQVVSGLKYIFNVEMVRTSCRKGGVEEVCAIHPDSKIANSHLCKLAVWTQPWLSKIQVVTNTCQ